MLRQGLLLDRVSPPRTLAHWSELAWLLQPVCQHLVRPGQVLAFLPLLHTPTYIGLVLGWGETPGSLNQNARKQGQKWVTGQLQLQIPLQGSKIGSQCSLTTVKGKLRRPSGYKDSAGSLFTLPTTLWNYQQGIYKVGTKVNVQQHTCPSTADETDKMWCIHTMDYLLLHGTKKVLVQAIMWVNLVNKILNERSQSQEAHILWFHLYEMSRTDKSMKNKK